LAEALLESAVRGVPYPLSLLQKAIERTRAEMGHSEWKDLNRRDARVALIKAVLNRRRRLHPQTTQYLEVRRDMDPKHDNPGYVLGRLMAVLERLQQEAIGDPNASVVDRFFSGASAAPKSVFFRLMKNARHHARKGKDGEKAGFVFLLERLLDEHADRFDPKQNGFPAHLSLEEQGLFILGYHQMRKWLWMPKEDRAQWEKDHADAPRAYQWNTSK
jgi:CRISPR-associated protein Csd1